MRASPEVLEARRDLLLRRNQGAKADARLQDRNLVGRVAVLQAVDFMIEILERIPPLA
jgi:hypothetical protein